MRSVRIDVPFRQAVEVDPDPIDQRRIGEGADERVHAGGRDRARLQVLDAEFRVEGRGLALGPPDDDALGQDRSRQRLGIAIDRGLAALVFIDEVLTVVSVQWPCLSLNPFGQRGAHGSISSWSSTLRMTDEIR